MSKFIKENIATILLVLTIIIIATIVVVKNKNEKVENAYDLSKVKVIDIKKATELYADVEPHFFIIARESCSACQSFLPAVNELIDKYKIEVYYIDLLKIDREGEDYEAFTKLLNFTYEYDGKVGTMDKFIGYTPMILISSNNETIYGSLGSMSVSALEPVLKEYSIIK